MDAISVFGTPMAPDALLTTAVTAVTVPLVFGYELQRRFGWFGEGQAKKCKLILRRCAPEAMGLAACLSFAGALRLRGDTTINLDPVEEEVWAQIKREWPVLMGADTLLGLQAMLRLLVLSSAVLHTGASGLGPLSGLAVVLLLGGALARGALAARTDVYLLDGPLGGALAVFCEVSLVPLLARLSFGSFCRRPVVAGAAAAGAMWIATRNYLWLAQDPQIDRLFILAHIFELFAAVAFLCRSVLIHTGPKEGRDSAIVGFMHLVMAFQQVLPAYYFLTAFDPHPKLVGAGRPFCILILGNLLQLAMYLCAAAFCLAGSFDGQEDAADAMEPPTDMAPVAMELEELKEPEEPHTRVESSEDVLPATDAPPESTEL